MESKKNAQEELEVVKERLEDIEKKLEERNEFADSFEEHKEVTHDHAHRIENAVDLGATDEL